MLYEEHIQLAEQEKEDSFQDIGKQNNGFYQQEGEDKQKNIGRNINRHRQNCYGKMVVLIKKPLVTLGPDYFCFLPAFFVFSVTAFFMLQLVFSNSNNQIAWLVAITICVGQPLSYLLVAISNPGIAMPKREASKQSDNMKNCLKCGYQVPEKSMHCQCCDVCIQGRDHHCPWTSKCIGKGNLCAFYVFLAMTPIFILYCAVAFAIFMAHDISNMNRQHLKVHTF